MIIYTQNACPKCLLVKFTLENAGVLEKVSFINLDEFPEIREELKTGEKSKDLLGLPILKYGEEFTNNHQEIINIVVSG